VNWTGLFFPCFLRLQPLVLEACLALPSFFFNGLRRFTVGVVNASRRVWSRQRSSFFRTGSFPSAPPFLKPFTCCLSRRACATLASFGAPFEGFLFLLASQAYEFTLIIVLPYILNCRLIRLDNNTVILSAFPRGLVNLPPSSPISFLVFEGRPRVLRDLLCPLLAVDPFSSPHWCHQLSFFLSSFFFLLGDPGPRVSPSIDRQSPLLPSKSGLRSGPLLASLTPPWALTSSGMTPPRP